MTTEDIAARLTEGRAAVDNTQCYVSAARQLGYQHPALTCHDRQIADWYDGEDGMDLRVLASDCAVLWAGVTAAEEALATQRALTARLATVWTGPGADAATAFLQQHCSTAAYVATGVRAAAEGCSALGDNLWRLVATKVAAAIAIDDRRIVDRPIWLAAARTLTGGVGDHSIAEQVITQHVIPYVDNDIRTDWLTAMQSARAAVTDCYDATVHRIAAMTPTHFDTPGGDFAAAHRLPAIGASRAAPLRLPRPASAAGPPPVPDFRPPANPVAGPPNDALTPPLNPGPVSDVGGLGVAPAADWTGSSIGGGELPAGAAGLGLLTGVGQLIANAISGLVATTAAASDPGAATLTAGDLSGAESPRKATEKAADRADGQADDKADAKLPGDTADEADRPPDDLSAGASDGRAAAPNDESAQSETPLEDREPDPPGDPPATADDGAATPSRTPSPGDQSAPSEAALRTPCQTAADELPQVGQ